MSDARFEDGAEAPLRLTAVDSDDLAVISALVQDAVFGAGEMTYQRRGRQFALLVNRFRWEDRDAAQREGRPFERVQALLTIGSVVGVASQGVPRGDADMVLSLLSLGFEPGADGAGRILLVLAGDGAVALDVECIDVSLRDVTRPYRAVSGKEPGHEG